VTNAAKIIIPRSAETALEYPIPPATDPSSDPIELRGFGVFGVY
jgi:hypothetical protein